MFLGSALWWLLLSGAAAWLGSRVGSGWMRLVNPVSGVIVFAFGAYALVTAW